jgi:probable addiction module antidote protein
MATDNPKLLPFDASRYLTDDEAIAEYIKAAIEADEPELLLIALRDIARAHGTAEAVKAARLIPEPVFGGVMESLEDSELAEIVRERRGGKAVKISIEEL